MRKILATFSGVQYHDTTKRIVEDGPKFGADLVWVYDDDWLRRMRPQHTEASRHLWTRGDVKGVDFFSFKPFVVLDALNRCQPDDAVLFVDADTYPIADLTPCFDIIKRDGHMVFRCCAQYHKWWCKAATYAKMGIALDPTGVPVERAKYYDVWHGCARFMGFTPSEENKQLMLEWYKFTLDPEVNTFDPSHPRFGPENPELHQPRCEQAILTNLVLQRGWYMWREACQFGECGDDGPQDRDSFKQLFVQCGDHSYDRQPIKYGSRFCNITD